MPNLNGCDEKLPKHYMPDMKCVPLRLARKDSWFNLSKSEVIGFAKPAYTLVTGQEISDPVRLPRYLAGNGRHGQPCGYLRPLSSGAGYALL